MAAREEIAVSRRWVVKVGSALLTDDGRGLDEGMIASLVDQLVLLRDRECEVVLVSSGAVGLGAGRALGQPVDGVDRHQGDDADGDDRCGAESGHGSTS